MKNYKYSFTMVELLVCITIIGLIMAMSVPAVKMVRNSYTSLSYSVFNNMKIISKSMFAVNEESPLTDIDDITHYDSADVVQPFCSLPSGDVWSNGIIKPDIPYNILSCATDAYNPSVTHCQVQDLSSTGTYQVDNILSRGVSSSGYPYCNEEYNVTDSESNKFNFCTRVASMANISGVAKCSAGNLFDVSVREKDGVKVPYMSALDLPPEERKNFYSIITPNFTATNGQKYFISKRTCNNSVSSDFCFRLIAVDLNGKKGPNKVSPRNEALDTETTELSKSPDIITFMIMDNGSIYPLGVAANNVALEKKGRINYLTSKIKIYAYGADLPAGSTSIDATCVVSDVSSGSSDVSSDNSDDVSTDDVSTSNHKDNCDFKVGYISGVSNYREQYCKSVDPESNHYSSYCKGITGLSECQSAEDCFVEPIKPVIRLKI